jgi:predicted metalloprotease
VGGGIGLLVVVVLSLVMGVDPSTVLQQVGTESPAGGPGVDDEGRAFVEVVLADTEQTWSELFRAAGGEYQEPTLTLFTGAVQSACGFAGAAVGPFYCPGDQQVYLDLGFFEELERRFGAPGDFARAYVIAHEVGHHVQTLLGTSQQVRTAQQGLPQAEANALSVGLELQADCYAGIWAHHARLETEFIESGDIEEGLGAAAAIGDDRLQRRAGGEVVPESFTHGSSEQRVRWFRQGLEAGTPAACDTFAEGGPGTR